MQARVITCAPADCPSCRADEQCLTVFDLRQEGGGVGVEDVSVIAQDGHWHAQKHANPTYAMDWDWFPCLYQMVTN